MSTSRREFIRNSAIASAALASVAAAFGTPSDTEQKAEDLYRKKYGEMSRKHNDEMKGRKKDVKDENPEP